MRQAKTLGWMAAMSWIVAVASGAGAKELKLELRTQTETKAGSGRFHTLQRDEAWPADKTAIIVCDVWDLHHCLNAVRRAEEFGPRLNEVLVKARAAGVTIIHSPSDCMASYVDHPARKRAIETPKAAKLPADIGSWCSRIPAEEQAVYPIDQSDGGEDDDPAEHAEWAAKLAAMGRNPKGPWKKQADMIAIDAERDFISDRGEEVWSILEQRGIQNVILAGVHTNMCVLGRPFGLRQMAKNGKNVVLLRDMTDTMYNPQRWPYVSHFTGTDRIISHIERYVCPTITSGQILGDGKAFRFSKDTRPHVAIVMAEDEYETERTLPVFADKYLGKDFRVSLVFGGETDRNTIPGLSVLDDADIALISVRRRVLPAESLAIVRRFVAAGKPVIGIRTASHAFSLRNTPPPDGHEAWPEFDAAVFGGHYTGHHGNDLKTVVHIAEKSKSNAILTGIDAGEFVSAGSLYKTSPLAEKAETLLIGRIENQPEEPAAWTFQRADGGRSFYTSLGHKSDFENPAFVRLLLNSLYWAADRPIPEKIELAAAGDRDRAAAARRDWTLVSIPMDKTVAGEASTSPSVAWFRCAVRVPEPWSRGAMSLSVEPGRDRIEVWLNGNPLTASNGATIRGRVGFPIAVGGENIWFGDANLLVLRVESSANSARLPAAPILRCGSEKIELTGRWQMRLGDDPTWSNIPLPAKFGTSTDIVFAP